MSSKFKLAFVIIGILLIAMLTMAAATGWVGPLAQTGMGMETATKQPISTESPAASMTQDTPTPSGPNSGSSKASPTMTSIFTGFTPDPKTTSTYYSSMGGNGMMGGGMTGTPSGMNTMGSMGTSGMDMSGCPMMSGSSMSSSGMGTTGMGDDFSMPGMDISEVSGYVEEDSTSILSDPWFLLGWVLLVLVIIAILVGAGLGIAWIVRRSRPTNPT